MKNFIGKEKSLFILDKDELLVDTLTQYFIKNQIQGGVLSGLGALKEAEIGFYHLHKKEYEKKIFHDEYELISLVGNVALKEGKPIIHVHAALGDSEFRVWGGHLFEAKVAVTAEISLIPYEFSPVREWNAQIGLFSICNQIR